MVELLADKSLSCSRIRSDLEPRAFDAMKAAFNLDKQFLLGQG